MFAFISSGQYPNVVSDGLMPPGLVLSGSIAANVDKPTAVTIHSGGGTGFTLVVGDDAVGNGTNCLSVIQSPGVEPDGGSIPALISRNDGVGGTYVFSEPMLLVQDRSSQTDQSLQKWTKNGVMQAQVDTDGLVVHNKLKTGASVTHTLGSYSGKSVPIYDESGTLLGYMPLYA